MLNYFLFIITFYEKKSTYGLSIVFLSIFYIHMHEIRGSHDFFCCITQKHFKWRHDIEKKIHGKLTYVPLIALSNQDTYVSKIIAEADKIVKYFVHKIYKRKEKKTLDSSTIRDNHSWIVDFDVCVDKILNNVHRSSSSSSPYTYNIYNQFRKIKCLYLVL